MCKYRCADLDASVGFGACLDAILGYGTDFEMQLMVGTCLEMHPFGVALALRYRCRALWWF